MAAVMAPAGLNGDGHFFDDGENICACCRNSMASSNNGTNKAGSSSSSSSSTTFSLPVPVPVPASDQDPPVSEEDQDGGSTDSDSLTSTPSAAESRPSSSSTTGPLVHADPAALKTDLQNQWVRRGNDLKDLAKFEESIQAYSNAIACDPRNPFLYYLRAVACENLPDWKAATDDLETLMGLIETGQATARVSMSFKAAGSHGDMQVSQEYLWLMSMGFRAVCREECVSSMHRRGEPIDYRMVEDAQEDVRLFLAAFRALPPEGSSIFSTYLGAYRRGRVLLSRQKLRALSGKYVAALDDALEVLKRESRADFCEVAGDMYRMCNLPADASRLYALSASKSRPSNQLRFKQAATCASAGKFRDAWYIYEDIQRRFLRGDFTKDLPSGMDDFYEFLADPYPHIPSSLSIPEALSTIVADLHKRVNGSGTTLGEPVVVMQSGGEGGKKKKSKRLGVGTVPVAAVQHVQAEA